MIKTELLVGGLKYNVTNDLKNWDEVEVALKREDYGGLIRSFSNTFEFVRGAFSLLENEYNLNYLNFKAVIIISVMNSELSWNEKYRNDLDVMTYKNDGYSCTINAKDSDLASLIKAGKSQTYDIPVESLSPNYTINYNRMMLKNSVNWFVNIEGQTEDDAKKGIYSFDTFRTKYTIPFVHGETNFIVKGKIEAFDVVLDEINNSYAPISDYPLIKAISEQSVTLSVRFDIMLISREIDKKSSGARVVFASFNKENKEIERYTTIITATEMKNEFNKRIDKSLDFFLSEGSYIAIFIEVDENIGLTNKISNVQDISITYYAKNKPVKFSAFTPKSLLSKLLYEITGRQVDCYISRSEDVNVVINESVLLLAAESIRNIANPKVHTSFSKFAEWMSTVFGYVYNIEDDKVIFAHRNYFYDLSQEKELEYVNEFNISLENKIIYSGIEIGYEKNDYDEINGRDEFNVTNSYKTDVNSTDSILKLISPYRADSYGIEFLAEKRDEDTKDNESDNNLFFVGVHPSSSIGDIIIGQYDISYVSNVTGVLFPNSVFNTMFSPRNMLLNNKRYIGACTKNLTFTASEGNADLAVNGVSEKDTVTIEAPLFRVEKISVDTPGLSPFPLGYKGLIRFEYNGITYKGFIDKIDENMGNHEATTYDLICRSIEVNN